MQAHFLSGLRGQNLLFENSRDFLTHNSQMRSGSIRISQIRCRWEDRWRVSLHEDTNGVQLIGTGSDGRLAMLSHQVPRVLSRTARRWPTRMASDRLWPRSISQVAFSISHACCTEAGREARKDRDRSSSTVAISLRESMRSHHSSISVPFSPHALVREYSHEIARSMATENCSLTACDSGMN
jgi:hypothetical protein